MRDPREEHAMQRTDVAPPARPAADQPPGLPAVPDLCDVPARRAVPWGAIRTLGGVAVLVFLLWRVGSGPFLDGVRMIDAWALAAALGVGATTVVACAWRWRLVAIGLGMQLPLRTAI